MLHIPHARRQFRDELAHLQRIRLRSHCPLQRFLKLRRRDHLHGLGNLADIPHRLAAFHNSTSLGHSLNPSLKVEKQTGLRIEQNSILSPSTQSCSLLTVQLLSLEPSGLEPPTPALQRQCSPN